MLFWGFGLFLSGTVLCAVAPSLNALLVARGVQAFGAAAGLVVSRAATRDGFDGAELTKVLATITMAFALVPALTPLLGGVVQSLSGWRAIFWVTFVTGLAVALWAARRLPETLRYRSGTLSAGRVLNDYLAIVGDRVFLGYALAVGLVFGSMSVFFAASPDLFIQQLGVSPAEYGLFPPVAVIGFILGGVITRRLADGQSPRVIAFVGLSIMTLSLAAMLAFPLMGLVHKHLFNVTMALNVSGLGIFLPTAISEALQRFPDRAGAAASVQGFIQMGLGALAAVAVGILQPFHPILAMPLTMLMLVLLAWFSVTKKPRQ